MRKFFELEQLRISLYFLIECLLKFSLKCFVVKTHERQHKKNKRHALSSRHLHTRVCVFAQLSIILRCFALFIPNSSIHIILHVAVPFGSFIPIHWTSSSWISIKKWCFYFVYILLFNMASNFFRSWEKKYHQRFSAQGWLDCLSKTCVLSMNEQKANCKSGNRSQIHCANSNQFQHLSCIMQNNGNVFAKTYKQISKEIKLDGFVWINYAFNFKRWFPWIYEILKQINCI